MPERGFFITDFGISFSYLGGIYLKVSPMKGLMGFGKMDKLGPRCVGLYIVLKRIGKVAYEI